MKVNPIEWLLEKENPSIRYFTLIDILDRPLNDPEVKAAKLNIMKNGVVPKILAKQNKNGYWDSPDSFYTAKYKGTVWQLIILAELGADGMDKQIKKACEFILENSQDPETGGFSMAVSKKRGIGLASSVIPCLTGNMVWSLIKIGYLNDPRVQKGINWIVNYQRFDDGVNSTPKGWRYERFTACFDKHSCFMGVVKALKALAEIPVEQRSEAVEETINEGTDFMLRHHIFKKSHDLTMDSKSSWKRFGFPLMYQTDVLEILLILRKLGYRDERMQEAIDLVKAKQDCDGRWRLENTFNGKFQVNIEKKGEQSKWITLNALRVLKDSY